MCIIRVRYVSDPANFWDGICEKSSHSPSFLGSTSSIGSFCWASFHLANLVPKWYVRGSPISCENKHDISSQKEVLYGSLPIYMLLSLQNTLLTGTTRFMGVSMNWGTPFIIHVHGIFPYKPTIWGSPIFETRKSSSILICHRYSIDSPIGFSHLYSH